MGVIKHDSFKKKKNTKTHNGACLCGREDDLRRSGAAPGESAPEVRELSLHL